LSGDGIQTLGIDQSGVKFDLNNSGLDASVGWITPGEGFLVDLPSGVTTVTNGSELFGTATVMPNGQTASNGFAALSAFDVNGSGVIDSSDPIFNQLEVWVATGSNGTTPTGSLYTLAKLNIKSLNLNATLSNQSSNGNTIGLISSYTTTSGKTYEMADVWLSSAAATSSAASQLAQVLSQYTASVAPNAQTASLSTLAAGVGSTANTSVAPNNVAVMTNALGTALNQYSNASPASTLSLTAPTVATQLVSTSSAATGTNPLVQTNPLKSPSSGGV
jgi:hypothetical protein